MVMMLLPPAVAPIVPSTPKPLARVQARAGLLRALLSERRTPPDIFGGECNCSARAERAGTTLDALKSLGLALQCATHHDYAGGTSTGGVPSTDPNFASILDARRKEYLRRHAGIRVDPKCTVETCPSGLRPASVPSTWKAPHVAIWTQRVIEGITNLADSDLFELPDVHVPSGTLGDTTSAARTVSDPRQKRSFDATMVQMANSFGGLKKLLSEADDTPNATALIDHLNDWWSGLAPITKDVTAALWDGRIRVGAVVDIVGDAGVTRAKTLGGTLAETGGYTVVRTDDKSGTVWITVPNRKVPLALAAGEYRRHVKVVVTTTAASPSKVKVGSIVSHTELGEGEVTSPPFVDNGIEQVEVFFVSLEDSTIVMVSELTITV